MLSLFIGKPPTKTDPTVEQKGLQKGASTSGFFQSFFGTGQEQKTLSEIRYNERRNYEKEKRKLKKDFHKQELEMNRELARQQKKIEGHYNIEHFSKRAHQLETKGSPDASYYSDVADTRQELADSRFGKIESRRLKNFHDVKRDQLKQLKHTMQKNIRGRMSSFKGAVRGGAMPSPPRRAA